MVPLTPKEAAKGLKQTVDASANRLQGVLDEKLKKVGRIISFNYETYMDILNLPDSGLTYEVEAEIARRYQEAGWNFVEVKKIDAYEGTIVYVKFIASE